MKIKKKGKVHPSPSPPKNDMEVVVLSVLRLLPQAILTLISVLSLQDREVLAYMITRSSLDSSSSPNSKKAKQPRTTTNHSQDNNNKSCSSVSFDCECFDCYRAYWVRWDSSPNRDLIHRAIDAFEAHPRPNTRSKRPKSRKLIAAEEKPVLPPLVVVQSPVQKPDDVEAEELELGVFRSLSAAVTEHRGIARKVLPDVLGLFNSRLWSLWSPNVY